MSLEWVEVTDENGVVFDALTNGKKNENDRISAWVFTDKASGFNDNVGSVNFKENLQKLDSGQYGA